MSVSVRPQRPQRGRIVQPGLGPFAEVPAADAYFPSASHEEAIARLSYLVEEHERCGILLGAAGTGKSMTLLRLQHLLKRTGWQASRIDLAGLDHAGLLSQIAVALGTNPPSGADLLTTWDLIEQSISGSSRTQQPRILLLDHADRLRPGAISVVEHLLHLPSPRGLIALFSGYREATPLMKIIGDHTGLRIELTPLSVEETCHYIEFTLERAMVNSCHLTPDAMQLVARISQGVPRRINRLCRAILVAAKTDYRTEIDSELVLAVTEELVELEALT